MKRLILPIAVLISINLHAQIDTLNQVVISNSGETFKSNSYILNFTLGEVAIATFKTGNIILSQGFHQPESVVVSSVNEIAGFGNEIRIYPNPTSEEIKLEFQLPQSEAVIITLFDITGRQLKTEIRTVFSDLITYDIRGFPSGQYLMIVMSLDKQKKQAYKILKQ